jgi:hypothetical protein
MANGWGGARAGAGRKPLSAAEHKRRGTYQASRHDPRIRKPELFWRPEWSVRHHGQPRTPALLYRLIVPGWYPDGLTDEEWRVLERIAAGTYINGVLLDPQQARDALTYSWLRPRRNKPQGSKE